MAERAVTFSIIGRDRASRVLDSVGTSADRAGGKLSRLGSVAATGAKATAGAIAGVGIAAGTGVAALATFGVRGAMSLERTTMGFTTLLGTARRSQAFLAQLKRFSAATPFDLPGVEKSAQLLLGVGVAAKNVIPTLTAWGNAAASQGATADDFNGVMLALSQSIGAGKINAQDMNQMVQRNIPVWRELSRALNMPVASVRKLSEQGKLMSADVLPKLQAQLQKDYGQGMANQMNTLSGQMSTLRETVGTGIAQAFLPLLPVLTSMVPAATAAAQRGVDKLAQGIGFVVPRLAAFIAGFRGMPSGVMASKFTTIVAAGDRLRTMALNALAAVRGFFSGINVSRGSDTRVQLAGIGTSLAALGPAVKSAASSLPTLSDALKVAGTVTGFLADHVDTLRKWMPTLVAGYIAWQGAQIVSNTIGRNSTIGLAMQIGANLSLAASNRTLASSIASSTLATGAQRTATIGATVATVAATARTVALGVAQRVAAVAAGVWAVAQRGLNLALAMNPVGLVVTAVAALAAGLIYAYRRSETFRNVVSGAFQVVRRTVATVVNVVLGYYGMLLSGAARAFGWIPGLGPKLRQAALWFEDFRNRAVAAIEGVNGRTITVSLAVQTIAASATRIAAKTRFEHGGWVGGPAGIDQTPILATRGEFVVRREVAQANAPLLAALNAGSRPTAVPYGGGGTTITVNVAGSLIGPSPDAVARALLPHIESAQLRRARVA